VTEITGETQYPYKDVTAWSGRKWEGNI